MSNSLNGNRLQILEQKAAQVRNKRKQLKRTIRDAAEKAHGRSDRAEEKRLVGLRADLDLFSSGDWRSRVSGSGSNSTVVLAAISEAVMASCREADGSVELIRVATRLYKESVATIDPELSRMEASLDAILALLDEEKRVVQRVELRRQIAAMHDIDAWISYDFISQIGSMFLLKYFKAVYNVDLSTSESDYLFYACAARLIGLRSKGVLEILGDARVHSDNFLRDVESGKVAEYTRDNSIKGFDEVLFVMGVLSMRVSALILKVKEEKHETITDKIIYEYLFGRFGRLIAGWKLDVLEAGRQHGDILFKRTEAVEILRGLDVPLDIMNIMPETNEEKPGLTIRLIAVVHDLFTR